MSATILPFTGTLVRVPPQPAPCRIVPVATDPELATERARLNGRPCAHEDGRVGIVQGVYREGLVIVAKLWRGMRFDPVRASRLTPVGGRVA